MTWWNLCILHRSLDLILEPGKARRLFYVLMRETMAVRVCYPEEHLDEYKHRTAKGKQDCWPVTA